VTASDIVRVRPYGAGSGSVGIETDPVRTVVVALEPDEVWALLDLRPRLETVLARRFTVCEDCGLLSAVLAGQTPPEGERWATVDDLPDVLHPRAGA
jgi:hypothetical protein